MLYRRRVIKVARSEFNAMPIFKLVTLKKHSKELKLTAKNDISMDKFLYYSMPNH